MPSLHVCIHASIYHVFKLSFISHSCIKTSSLNLLTMFMAMKMCLYIIMASSCSVLTAIADW